jgi:ferritin-like metal-binding protein YciE
MHEQQTRQQIQNLDHVFQILGQQPQRIPCLAVQGLKQEHDTFLTDNPTPNVLTMFDLGAAFKTEHYEIASYMGLIEMAQLMGQQQVVQLLQQNLQQEQEMARIVQQVSMQLGRQHISPMTQTGQAHQAPQTNP